MIQVFNFRGMCFGLDVSADRTDGYSYEPPSKSYSINKVISIYRYPDEGLVVSDEFSDFVLENIDFWEAAENDFWENN